MRQHVCAALFGYLLLFLVATAMAQIPDLNNSYTEVATTEDSVSVYCLPNGEGWPLTEAMIYLGGITDATITVTLLDINFDPVVAWPAEDIWLESDDDGLVIPPGGSIADASTDEFGQTTFTYPLYAGGTGRGMHVVIESVGRPGNLSLLVWFVMNSPDLNGDGMVNLVDVVLFANIWFSKGYDYSADFYWDGVINLSDLIYLSQGMGAAFP